MADYAAEFKQLADRFRGIEARNSETGERYVQRIAAQACKLAAHCSSIGVLPFGHKGVPKLEFYEDDTRAWDLPWYNLLLVLKRRFPERVPADVGVQQMMGPDPDNPHFAGGSLSSPADWEERAQDFAVVCQLLAELVVTEGAGQISGLTEEDNQILMALKDRFPVLVKQEDLAAATEISRRTVGNRLEILRERGLVHRPEGERKGDTLTDQGHRILTGR